MRITLDLSSRPLKWPAGCVSPAHGPRQHDNSRDRVANVDRRRGGGGEHEALV